MVRRHEPCAGIATIGLLPRRLTKRLCFMIPMFLLLIIIWSCRVEAQSWGSGYCEERCECGGSTPYYYYTTDSWCCALWSGYCQYCCSEPEYTAPSPPPPAVSKTCDGTVYIDPSVTAFNDGSDPSLTYSDNLACQWVINPGFYPIQLEFGRFDTESGYDFVEVLEYDSIQEGWYRLASSLSGTDLPPAIQTTGDRSAMMVTFTSDGTSGGSGFYATISQGESPSPPPPPPPPPPVATRACSTYSDLTSSSGTITDGSGESAEYVSDGTSCSWLINPGHAPVRLEFTELHTELDYDFIRVYDGFSDNAPLLGEYSGNYEGDRLPILLSTGGDSSDPQGLTGHALFVVLVTDSGVGAPGFSARFSAGHCDRMTTVYESTGTITDNAPLFGTYDPYTRCTWIVDPGFAPVELTFDRHDVEDGYDYIYVYQVLDDGTVVLLSEVTGSHDELSDGQTISTYNTVGASANFHRIMVDFVADGFGQRSGFAASYKQGTVYCSGTTAVFTEESGSIDDGSPLSSEYLSNTECQWLIQPGYGASSSIQLSFDRFDTEGCCDYVTIYNGDEALEENLIVSLSGSMLSSADSLDWTFTTFGNQGQGVSSHSMLVVFQSDGSVEGAGFNAVYERVDLADSLTSTNPLQCEALTYLSSPTGTFTDGSPPSEPYDQNLICEWVISPGYSNIELVFERLDIGSMLEFISVHDAYGNELYGSQRYVWDTPFSLRTDAGSLTVKFVTGDESEVGVLLTGFSASYSEYIPGATASCVLEAASVTANHGDVISRTRYLDPSPGFDGSCSSQVQTSECVNGQMTPWTGSYVYETCSLACSSTARSGDIETKTFYQAATVPHGSACQGATMTRLCTNGEFGSWEVPVGSTESSVGGQFDECYVDCPSMVEGISVPAGSQATLGYSLAAFRFMNADPPPGSQCQGQMVFKECVSTSAFSNQLAWAPAVGWSDAAYSEETCTMSCISATQTKIAGGGIEYRKMYRFQSVGNDMVGVDQCELQANSMNQMRECNNGTLSEWTAAPGQEKANPSEFVFSTCTQGCGEGMQDGSTDTALRYRQLSVAPGESCDSSAFSSTFTRTCNRGQFSDWSSADGVSIDDFPYEECFSECNTGCEVSMRGNGSPDDACNVEACCFDNGDYTAWMLDTAFKARHLAVSGNMDQSISQLDSLCVLLPQLDSSSSSWGNSDQRNAAQLACTYKSHLENGLDIFGNQENYVTPVQWTQYEELLERYTDVIEDYDASIDRLGMEQRVIDAIDTSAAAAEENIAASRNNILSEMQGSFLTLSSNVDRQQAGIGSAIDLLNAASSEMESLKAALMDNHRTLLQNQDVLIHDGKLALANGKRLQDSLGSVVIDLKSHIASGAVDLVTQNGIMNGGLVAEIRAGTATVTEVVVDGDDLVVEAVKTDGTMQTARAIQIESEELGLNLKAADGKLTQETGTIKDVMLRSARNTGSRIEELSSKVRNVNQKVKKASTPEEAWDADGDGFLACGELVVLLEDSSQVTPLGRRVWNLAQERVEVPTEQRRHLLAAKSRKFGSKTMHRSTDKSSFVDSVKDELISAGEDWLIGTLEDWATSADEDGEFAEEEVVGLMVDIKGLYDDGKALWDAANDLVDAADSALDWASFASSASSAVGAATGLLEYFIGGSLEELEEELENSNSVVDQALGWAIDAGQAVVSCGEVASVFTGNVFGLGSIPDCIENGWETIKPIAEAAYQVASDCVDWVVDTAGAVGEAIWEGVEYVGNAIYDFGSWLLGRRRLLQLPGGTTHGPVTRSGHRLQRALEKLADLQALGQAHAQWFKAGAALADHKRRRSLLGIEGAGTVFDGQYAKEIANLTVLIPEERLQKYRSKFQAELRSVSSVAQEGFTGISETLGAETAKAMSTWGSVGLRHVASMTASSLEVIKSDAVEALVTGSDSLMCTGDSSNAGQIKAELSREVTQEYIPLLTQQKRDWVYRSMELMYVYAQQFRYAKLSESPLIPLDLPAEPGHEDFTRLLADLQTQNMEINEQVGRSANEMTAAYTIYRNDQEPVFQQLEQTGNALVTVPMPEKSRYYNVRMKEVRLYLKPITGSPTPNLVELQLQKGTESSFFSKDGRRWVFQHPSPATFSFKYFYSSCSAASSNAQDGNEFVAFSPYGTWNITVTDPYPSSRLNGLQQLRFEFRIEFEEALGSSGDPLFGGDVDNPNGVGAVEKGKEGGNVCLLSTPQAAARITQTTWPVSFRQLTAVGPAITMPSPSVSQSSPSPPPPVASPSPSPPPPVTTSPSPPPPVTSPPPPVNSPPPPPPVISPSPSPPPPPPPPPPVSSPPPPPPVSSPSPPPPVNSPSPPENSPSPPPPVDTSSPQEPETVDLVVSSAVSLQGVSSAGFDDVARLGFRKSIAALLEDIRWSQVIIRSVRDLPASRRSLLQSEQIQVDFQITGLESEQSADVVAEDLVFAMAPVSGSGPPPLLTELKSNGLSIAEVSVVADPMIAEAADVEPTPPTGPGLGDANPPEGDDGSPSSGGMEILGIAVGGGVGALVGLAVLAAIVLLRRRSAAQQQVGPSTATTTTSMVEPVHSASFLSEKPAALVVSNAWGLESAAPDGEDATLIQSAR